MAKKKNQGNVPTPGQLIQQAVQQVTGGAIQVFGPGAHFKPPLEEEEMRDQEKILKGLVAPILGNIDQDYITIKRYQANTDCVVYLQETYGKFTLMKCADVIMGFFDPQDYVMIKFVEGDTTRFIRVRTRDGQVRDTFDVGL